MGNPNLWNRIEAIDDDHFSVGTRQRSGTLCKKNKSFLLQKQDEDEQQYMSGPTGANSDLLKFLEMAAESEGVMDTSA